MNTPASPRRLLSALLLLGALLLAACGEARHAPLPAGATVLVLGDSVSHGTGAAAGEDYPTQLAASSGWNVVNAGVPGDTTADGLARLPQLLDAHAPQLLLVELGGNDFLRRVPQPQTAANLRAILDEARARGIPAVLVAAPRPSLFGAAVGQLGDDPLYAELAAATGTPLIEDVMAEVLSDSALKADPIHPNAAGYRQMAEDIHAALAELGFLAR